MLLSTDINNVSTHRTSLVEVHFRIIKISEKIIWIQTIIFTRNSLVQCYDTHCKTLRDHALSLGVLPKHRLDAVISNICVCCVNRVPPHLRLVAECPRVNYNNTSGQS